jgi:probable H4MPT-linked C1 transfer pathway protein
MRAEAWIGWDVGGAHLKAARLNGAGQIEAVHQFACPLWQGMANLEAAFGAADRLLGPSARHAVTMTGEMVDLFPDRATGVAQLVATIVERYPGATIAFYAGERGFLASADATRDPLAIASANWRASAALVARRADSALFLDVGSTTTDLIPVHDGRVQAVGHDDATRLVAGELLYTGVVRTPIMALTREAPFGGASVPLMAEYFATTADVYRILGRLPDGADLHPAADGGEKSVEASVRRLARMLGRDGGTAPLTEWRRLAAWLAESQLRLIADGCARLLSRGVLNDAAPVVTAGVGRFLARQAAERSGCRVRDFSDLVGAPSHLAAPTSDCAPAVAVASLAREAVDA